MSWLVDGLIPSGHTVLTLGKPHNGKSWFTNQLAVSIASGDKFCGLGTTPSTVILIDEDSPSDTLLHRMKRLAKGSGTGHELETLPIHMFAHGEKIVVDSTVSTKGIPNKEIMRSDFSLGNNIHREWLKSYASNLVTKRRNVVIIIDSLLRVLPGQNLNLTNSAMFAAACWHDLKVPGVTLIIVHHMSLKRQDKFGVDEALEFDPSHLAMGNTMLVANCDTMLIIHRVPSTAKTEFIVKPFERREKIPVGAFSCELTEDKELTYARLEMLGEPTRLPSDAAKMLFPMFFNDDDERDGMTVAQVMKRTGRALSEKDVRDALKELEREEVLTRGKEKHNRFVYRINPQFESGFMLTTAYTELLYDEM